MSDKEREELEFDEMDDEPVVVMTDEEGNEYYYREELIITVGDKRYAILAPLEDEELECGDCGCGDEDCRCADDFDDLDVFIARVDLDENGEEIYTDPTDEEFEAVRAAYEKLMDEEEI